MGWKVDRLKRLSEGKRATSLTMKYFSIITVAVKVCPKVFTYESSSVLGIRLIISEAFVNNGDNGLFKTPIALDRYPWNSLKECEQKLALKTLQVNSLILMNQIHVGY